MSGGRVGVVAGGSVTIMEQDDLYFASQAYLLKKYRKKKQLTQQEVSAATGLQRSTIAMLESGKRGKKSDSLITLLKFYEVSIKSFHKRVTENISEIESTSPFEEGSDGIDHEWMMLTPHILEQAKDTINDFNIRNHIAKNYGLEALQKLNQLVGIFSLYKIKNQQINRARNNKDKRAFRAKNSLFLGKLTSRELDAQLKKNFAWRKSPDRYYKRFPKLFFFYIHQVLQTHQKTKSNETISDVLLIVKSLNEQKPSILSSEMLLSNEMSDSKLSEDFSALLEDYLSEAIKEMERYTKKYPKAIRDNFQEMLESEIKT